MRTAFPTSKISTVHPRKARSPQTPSSTPGAVCVPGQPPKQWVATVKVTCAGWRPLPDLVPPDTNSQDRPGFNLHPPPRENASRIPSPGNQLVPPPSEFKAEDGHRPQMPHTPNHSPAENWPWTDPRRGHGDRNQSATKAGSAAAATSMASLGEVSSSFAKSLRGVRGEIHQPAARPTSWGARGDAAATRQHFRPCTTMANYLAGESVARQPRPLLSMLGRGSSG